MFRRKLATVQFNRYHTGADSVSQQKVGQNFTAEQLLLLLCTGRVASSPEWPTTTTTPLPTQPGEPQQQQQPRKNVW